MRPVKEQSIRLHRREEVRACFCIGRQNGEPECPCRMRARGRMEDEVAAPYRAELLRLRRQLAARKRG